MSTPFSQYRAAVAISSMRRNTYFAEAAASTFASVDYLASRPTPDELRNLLREYDALIIGPRERIDGHMLDHDVRTKLVGSLSIGLDHLDLTALHAHGISVANSPTANVRSVAEHNVALIFALAKKLKAADAAMSDGSGRAGIDGMPVEVAGKTAGLLGYGKIGALTARMLHGLDVHVVATSRSRRSGSDGIARFVETETVLTRADIVVLALPLTTSTAGLIGRPEIDLMKNGAILINTCRPEIIADHRYLREELVHRLGGFGADYDEDTEKLSSLQNVIVSPPHRGAHGRSRHSHRQRTDRPYPRKRLRQAHRPTTGVRS